MLKKVNYLFVSLHYQLRWYKWHQGEGQRYKHVKVGRLVGNRVVNQNGILPN